MIEEALKIYKKLLEQGEIRKGQDKELFEHYTENLEIRETLANFERELDFKIVETPRTLYFVPNIENKILSFSLRELREVIRSDAKPIDSFLLCYIIMFILYLFYGGKNSDPKQAEFLQLKDIIQALDERFSKIDEDEKRLLEEDYSINFQNIADEWHAKQVDGERKKYKKIYDKKSL